MQNFCCWYAEKNIATNLSSSMNLKDANFWKKHSKNLVTDKIEIKKTHDGHQIVAIMSLPIDKDEQNEWIEFYKKKMDDLSNVD